MRRQRHANEKLVNGRWVFDEDKAHEDWGRTYFDKDGIVRWKSNDNVPPQEILWDFVCIKAIDVETRNRSMEVNNRETSAFLADYREKMRGHVPSAEERFEMRAAFGGGAELVNIVTGERITT